MYKSALKFTQPILINFCNITMSTVIVSSVTSKQTSKQIYTNLKNSLFCLAAVYVNVHSTNVNKAKKKCPCRRSGKYNEIPQLRLLLI